MQEHPEVPEELGIEVGVRFRDQDFLIARPPMPVGRGLRPAAEFGV